MLARRAVAFAHAVLVSSDPAAGSHLAAGPSRLRLVFSEPIELAMASVSLVAGDGRSEKLAVEADPRDVHAVIARVGGLGEGAYRVMWRVVSADGHPADGSFVFWVAAQESVAAPAPAAPPPDIPPSLEIAPTWGPTIAGAPAIAAALRGLGLGCLMALAGLSVFSLSGRERNNHAAAAALAMRLAVAAAGLLTLHLAAWMLSAAPEHRLTADAATAVVATTAGKIEAARTALAVLALWALWLARRAGLSLVFATCALLVSGAAGHPAALHPAIAIPAKAIHLLAGAAWLGGLLWLITCRKTDADASDAAFGREAFRVSAVALVSVGLVALSGAVQTVLFLPSIGDVVQSTYGAVVLAKTAGLVVLVGFGAHHRYRVLPNLARGNGVRFGASLRREVAVMSVVILLGGLLAYLSPPHHADIPANHSHAE